MAGLEKIIGEISLSSDTLVKELLDKAGAEAAEIKQKAEKEAEESVARIRRESETRLSDSKARAQSAAALARRQLLLQEKQNLIGEVMEKAKKKFLEMPDAQYFDAVIKLVQKNALAQDGEIVFNERDKKRLPANFAQSLAKAAEKKGGKLKVSDKSTPIDGGFILSYGGVDQNCSVSALFEEGAETLQDKIQTLLFE
ncbi:MAG: hypothetical protein IJQ12_00390 [Lachnospiraceae bacterium]|nr:hypothetical protein [Lachnospiraceae bacterium]